MAILNNTVSSIPLTYHTQAFNNNSSVGVPGSLGDTLFSFLDPGSQAQSDWKRDEQHAENSFLRELYSDSTKYQRAVDDMRKAGLNPEMLFGSGSGSVSASSGGSPASSGSGGSSLIKDLLKLGADIGIAIATKGKSTTMRSIGFSK